MLSTLHNLPLSFPCSGRISFYDRYGVIRDILQNHLTEVLTLVAMELPHNISSVESVLQHKLQAFQALRGLQKGSAVLGQYQAYSEQVHRELQKPDSFRSLTPTFAGGLWSWALVLGCPLPAGGSFPNPDAPGCGLAGTGGRIFTRVFGPWQGRTSLASLAFYQPDAVGCHWLPQGEGHPRAASVQLHPSPSWAQTWLPSS